MSSMDNNGWNHVSLIHEITLVFGGALGINFVTWAITYISNFDRLSVFEVILILGLLWILAASEHQWDESLTPRENIKTLLIRTTVNVLFFIIGVSLLAFLSTIYSIAFSEYTGDSKWVLVQVEDPTMSLVIPFISIMIILSLIRGTIMIIIVIVTMFK